MESDKVVLKATVEGNTLDQMIAALQRLKKLGVPGDTWLNEKHDATARLNKHVARRKELLDKKERADKQYESTGSRGYQGPALSESENEEMRSAKNAISNAKTIVWVEYEAPE